MIHLAAFAGKSAKIRGAGTQPILVDKHLAGRVEVRGKRGPVNGIGVRTDTEIGCSFSPCLSGNTDQPILESNSSWADHVIL